MRIIAGIARGMPLTVPRGGNVRPTSDRVREAIFSSLGDRVIGVDALDLFAGSGALGLEAASRGTRSVVFVERSRTVIQAIEENLLRFRRNRSVECELTVMRGDVLARLGDLAQQGRAFSLIFADPPYGAPLAPLLRGAQQRALLAEDGLLVLEAAKRDVPVVEPSWKVVRESVYGDTRVSFLALA